MLYKQTIERALAGKIGEGGVPDKAFGDMLLRTEEGLAELRTAYEQRTMPLLRLPERKDDLEALEVVAKKLQEGTDIAFLGTGGSSLGGQTLAQIERVGTMPEQGISSAFNFGKGYGFWIGMLVANFIRYEEIHPLTWKKAMLSGMGSKGQGANKKVPSMLKAQQLFPKYAHLLFSEWRGKRYPKDGRAEALLMAEHSRQRHFGLMRVTEVPARKRRAIKADVATDVNRAEAEGLQAKDDAVRAEDTISKKDGGNQ